MKKTEILLQIYISLPVIAMNSDQRLCKVTSKSLDAAPEAILGTGADVHTSVVCCIFDRVRIRILISLLAIH